MVIRALERGGVQSVIAVQQILKRCAGVEHRRCLEIGYFYRLSSVFLVLKMCSLLPICTMAPVYWSIEDVNLREMVWDLHLWYIVYQNVLTLPVLN